MKEQKTRQVRAAEHARNWVYRRFGVDETPLDNSSRVIKTEATTPIQGFVMKPDVAYEV